MQNAPHPTFSLHALSEFDPAAEGASTELQITKGCKILQICMICSVKGEVKSFFLFHHWVRIR